MTPPDIIKLEAKQKVIDVLQPDTVKDIAKNASGILGGKFTEYTGVSAGDLKNMSTSEIEELLLTNQKFAASMAIVTYYRNQKKKKE